MAEGSVADEKPDRDIAQRLADANNSKYADYGYNMTAETYIKSGVTALRARRVLAWTKFPENATRFVFGSNDA
jgi:hypothetical protein